MSKIVIDARISGTTTGRYIDKLIEHMHRLKPAHHITVLTKSDRIEFMKKIAPDFEVQPADYKEFTLAEQWGLRNHLRRLNPELVHFGMTQQPIYYYGRSVTTVHDLTTVRYRNPAKNWLVFMIKQMIYRLVIIWVAHKSRVVIAISNYVKQDLAKFAHIKPAKIQVVYEAADKIPAPAEPVVSLQDKSFIMYIGRPTPHKNLKRLIEAFSLIRQTQPDLVLALAGKKDSNYQTIERWATRKNLLAGVVFTDFISEGQLRWMYEHTAAYVFPSLSEGFGLPGLEAMAHGAPVISSNATCLPEIYGKAAHYFDPKDTADMTKKIIEVISNNSLRSHLIKAGAAQYKKYSWVETAEQTLKIYDQALK